MGKGTFSKLLSQDFKYLKITPGDIIRNDYINGSSHESQAKIKEKVKRGELLDDKMVIQMVIDYQQRNYKSH